MSKPFISSPATSGFKLTAKQQEAANLLAGPQRHTMLFGGSRSGKTFLLCRMLVVRAHKYPATRHIILRQRANAVRNSIFLDTMPKVFRLCFPGIEFREEKSLQRWVLPWNDSEIWTGGLDDKDRVDKILGTEYATMYFNECSQIPFGSIETALSRLAQVCNDPSFVQRAYYDLNPSGNRHWSYRQFIEHKHPTTLRPLFDAEQYKYFRINPADNKENLSEHYIKELEGASERIRRRFLLGEYIPEMEGALWNSETIDRGRLDPILPSEVAQHGITRIAIGVDPSGASGDDDNEANAIGIVVMGRTPGVKGHGYVLEDATLVAHPSVWARKVVDLYDKWNADVIVAEDNFGGEMVKHTIKTANHLVRVKKVTASRGKHIRAEPVAALYEEAENSGGAYTGRIHHAGAFNSLEDELCNMTDSGYHGIGSPNRLDALVWAATELFGKGIVSEDSLVSSGSFSRFPRETV